MTLDLIVRAMGERETTFEIQLEEDRTVRFVRMPAQMKNMVGVVEHEQLDSSVRVQIGRGDLIVGLTGSKISRNHGQLFNDGKVWRYVHCGSNAPFNYKDGVTTPLGTDKLILQPYQLIGFFGGESSGVYWVHMERATSQKFTKPIINLYDGARMNDNEPPYELIDSRVLEQGEMVVIGSSGARRISFGDGRVVVPNVRDEELGYLESGRTGKIVYSDNRRTSPTMAYVRGERSLLQGTSCSLTEGDYLVLGNRPVVLGVMEGK